jgi:hypothetical protein
LPTSTIPKGDLNPSRKKVRRSGTPPPVESRSKVMRLALGTEAPVFFISSFFTQFLNPLPSPGRTGALVSATSTSPFGRT